MKPTSQKLMRRPIFGSCLVIGLLAATLANAGTNRPECDKNIYAATPKKHAPRDSSPSCTLPGSRFGAIGAWENRSGDRIRVRVEPGEGGGNKLLSRVARDEYHLVRCDTV